MECKPFINLPFTLSDVNFRSGFGSYKNLVFRLMEKAGEGVTKAPSNTSGLYVHSFLFFFYNVLSTILSDGKFSDLKSTRQGKLFSVITCISTVIKHLTLDLVKKTIEIRTFKICLQSRLTSISLEHIIPGIDFQVVVCIFA